MSYRFESGEPVPDAIRRIVTEQIDKAMEQLSGTQRTADIHIHEARKCFKKIRAVLRLVQPELGALYRENNIFFRDAGRKLSQARDAGVLVDTFEKLVSNIPDEYSAKTVSSLRNLLKRRKTQLAGTRSVLKEHIQEVTRNLLEVRSQVAAWPLHNNTFKALSPGLLSIYRDGRKALKVIQTKPSPYHFHELRKQVKHHWYNTRLLYPVWPSLMKAAAMTLSTLSDDLGEHHDLTVFRQVLLSDEIPDTDGLPLLLADLATRQQQDLACTIVMLSERIYAEKPPYFLRRIHRYWNIWRKESVGTA